MSLPLSFDAASVFKGDRELERAGPPLSSGRWCVRDGRLYICFDLEVRSTILVRRRRDGIHPPGEG
ncbi:MAG TPA: hypothetical protein EYP61_01040 [Candidatus Latescibacteria bacterium]|nr:hypothetical protein [Candidatus Latescibacterota bacterium]